MREAISQPADQPSAGDPAELLAEAERVAQFGTWKWEIESGRVSWSDELHRIYGLEPGGFAGTVDAFIERLHPDDRDRVWSQIARSIDTLKPFAFEERIVRADGTERTLVSQGRVMAGADGNAAALLGVCHDVTERADVERALGTSERRMQAIVDNTPALVTVKDLDGRYLMSNAESVNVIGIAPEDLVGKRCADVFPAHIAAEQRANDKLAAAEGVPVYGEAMISRDGEERHYVTVTFALPDEHGAPAETCTIATDVTESRELESERTERLGWTERIRATLEEDRLLAYAQPIVNLETGAQVSCELLARMKVPGEGDVAVPQAFLPQAERYGLIQPVDVWMVERALELALETPAQVNVSAVTMCDPEAREQIAALLAAAPEAARRVVFEITETANAVFLEAAQEFAAEITRVGARLALDDFGVGWGSFTYLRTLPVSFIKIDGSFVANLAESNDDRNVVKAIIDIAREFGLWTVAEGVEDARTLDIVRAMGATFAQGFHLGRPEPVEAP
jgi:PAS domain S-box-containing protein